MGNDQDIFVFAVALIVLMLAIGVSVYVMLRHINRKIAEARALSPQEVRAQYVPDMPEAPILYSILADKKMIIKDESGAEIATITYPIAKDRLCRVITIGTTPYECHWEFGMLHAKAHLYQPGADPETSTPLLTFSPKATQELYLQGETERYRRALLDRQSGKGWAIYSNDTPVAYIEDLYGALKASAFLSIPYRTYRLLSSPSLLPCRRSIQVRCNISA